MLHVLRPFLRPPRFLRAALHPDIPSDPALCPNCGTAFPEPRPHFCGECGQEARLRPPTLGEFGQQLGGAYISMEGALWRTLWRLFLLPGQLTLEYFAGRRRRYVLPLRLYLTISVIALLMLRVVTGQQFEANSLDRAAPADGAASRPLLQIEDQIEGRTEGKTNGNVQIGGLAGMRFGFKDGVFYCEKLPASTCKRLERRIAVDKASLQHEMLNVGQRSLNNLGATMFVLLPAFALWLKLIFIDKRLRYTEHLVFALHLHAFWFAMLLLMLVPWEPLASTAALASVAYPLVALQRVYRTRWWSTLLRASALMVLNISSTTVVVALLFLATLLS